MMSIFRVKWRQNQKNRDTIYHALTSQVKCTLKRINHMLVISLESGYSAFGFYPEMGEFTETKAGKMILNVTGDHD